jgi:hypothetical protein
MPTMTPTQKAHRQGTLYMLLVIAIWGGFLPVGKSALQAIDPYWLTASCASAPRRWSSSVLLAVREGRDKLRTDGQTWKILVFGACGFTGFGICAVRGPAPDAPRDQRHDPRHRPDPVGAGAMVAHQAPAGQLHPGDDRAGRGWRSCWW